jgi:hypothetical protein
MPNPISARDLELDYRVANVCYSHANAKFYWSSVGARIVETRRNDIVGVVKTLGLNTEALHGMPLNRHRLKIASAARAESNVERTGRELSTVCRDRAGLFTSVRRAP